MSVCTVPKTQGGYSWPSKPDLISACLLAALQPLANVLCNNIWPLKLWLFLAALNGNYCGISSVGLISCSLTQPLSLSHFVCPLLLLTELPMLGISHDSLCYSTARVCGTYSGWLSEPIGLFGGRWGIPEVVVIPNGQVLLHGGGDDWMGCQGN